MVTSKFIIPATIALCMAFGVCGAATGLSIAQDKIDKTKIYFGSADQFEKAAEVRYDEVIKETPEYAEVKKNKIERGSGRYWVLLSQASDRANRAISSVGEKTEYDLIALAGYLKSVDPEIPADDITASIVKAMEDGTESAK